MNNAVAPMTVPKTNKGAKALARAVTPQRPADVGKDFIRGEVNPPQLAAGDCISGLFA